MAMKNHIDEREIPLVHVPSYECGGVLTEEEKDPETKDVITGYL